MDEDLAYKAHMAAEDHLAACWAAFDAEQEGDEEVEWPEQMGGPFCGCSTCEVREVLTAAWPLLLEAARQEAAQGA